MRELLPSWYRRAAPRCDLPIIVAFAISVPRLVTLRLRLIVLLSVLLVSVFAAATTALLSNTRANVGAESRAALGLVDALARRDRDGVALFSTAELEAIARTRHLRVDTGTAAPGAARAPEWFARLVLPPALAAPVEVRLAAEAGGARIHAAPEDEIAEAWDDFAGFAVFALMLLLGLGSGASFIVQRELAPLDLLAQALQHVERGALDVRLPRATLPEVERLCIGFNRMAAALAEARRTNRELTRRLIGTQESERRALARELHDEFGQHLTAIRADAAALQGPGATAATVRASGRAIEQTGATMMRLLRSMLERLRPEALDVLGLCAAFEDLVAAFRLHNHDVVVTLDLPQEIEVDDEHAIVLYRVAQEALTNVSRHARARRVSLALRVSSGVVLEVADDGCGMPRAAYGFGLAGMRERVESCGGRLEVSVGLDGRGVLLRASFAPGRA